MPWPDSQCLRSDQSASSKSTQRAMTYRCKPLTVLPRYALYHHAMGNAWSSANCNDRLIIADEIARNTLGDHAQSSTCFPLEPVRIPNEASAQQITRIKAAMPASGDGRSHVGSQVGTSGGGARPRSEGNEDDRDICRTKARMPGFLESVGLVGVLICTLAFSLVLAWTLLVSVG